MSTITQSIAKPYYKTASLLDHLQPLALLLARYYIAWVFFSAGLTKLRDWESTLFLFEEEYHVPFIPFELAAYLGTAGELILPILLMLGLATRFGALGLTIVNIIAVVSLEEIAPAALYSHVIWGILLAQVVFFGAGRIALDYWLEKKVQKHL